MSQSTIETQSVFDRLNAVALNSKGPVISASPVAVAINGTLQDINLADSNIFLPVKTSDKFLEHTIGYAVQEQAYIAKMNYLLEEGEKLLSSLYSYRSCSRAIPQVQSNDQTNRLEMYETTFTVLQPEVNKMRKFMAFRDAAITGVTDIFAKLIPKARDTELFASTQYLEASARLLDMFVIMDAMKNVKGSMNNDFSMYRRAVQSSNRDISEDETVMQHKLYSFLANQDQYSSELKTRLATLPPTYEEIIIEMMELCATRLETSDFIPARTKHTYYRAIAFALYLLDGAGDDHDITKRKKFKIERFGKLFKACPVVPLFADQYVFLSTIYGKAPHLGNVKWEETDETAKAALARTYSLALNVDATRQEYTDNMSSLKRAVNILRSSEIVAAQTVLKDVYTIVEQSVKLLVRTSTKVLEQSAWKYANPVNPQLVPSIPAEAFSYELAVRYNYSVEDKRALIEYIAMIKNLTTTLLDLEPAILVAINQHIYADIQQFVNLKLNDYHAHASKKKRAVASIMKHLRDILLQPAEEVRESRIKDSPKPHSISPTQLQMLCTVLHLCFSDKAKGMKGGLMKEKDFKDAQVAEVDAFLARTALYFPMLNLEGTVQQVGNLANLWFKEFYLELSKKVQFPISMSLPWLLTESILESNDTEMLQYTFYPFELYNDSAFRALYYLNSKFIYDEIVAEVSLCFDQLIFKTSQKMYSHFKKAAGAIVLSSDLKGDMNLAHMDFALGTYAPILQQKNYQLLGRSLNIPDLIANMMNTYLRKSIDIAISRYEASDFTHIMDLETLIRTVHTTHKLLSEYMSLDPFEDMLAEVDEAMTLGAANGRIVTHTIAELVYDVMPNYTFNNVTNRFLRGPDPFTKPISRNNLSKALVFHLYGSKAQSVAFHAQNGIFKGYMGEEHFHSLVRLVGKTSVAAITAELARQVNAMITDTLSAYIREIAKGTPQALKLPLFEYGTAGTFEYFAAHLKPLLSYAALKSDVLQSFRKVGNAVVIVKFLEDVLAIDGTLQEIQSKAFGSQQLSNNPRSSASLSAENTDSIASPEEQAAIHFQEALKINQQIYAPSPPPAIMETFLTSLRDTLEDAADEWQAHGSLENPRAFFRIWSSLQFTFCVPSVGEGKLVRELFGDGLAWAGCTFIHLLNQTDLFTAFDFNSHVLSAQKADKKAAHLTFGFGSYGGNAPNPVTGEKPPTSDPAGSPIGTPAATAAGLRSDVIQYLESAAFYQNVNEEVFATLVGMQSVI
ncbi:cytoplasmic fragile-X interacting family-domain-containing protein [Fimicolochytrium jonesii]|uniref:cytoplasmic fragile-X interacting family-domain-containing protein n=1 Tax=Fimicolochytrium jonesii TaxID=1396493 RepID=UPI0022FF1929|nr:cytoplasmic fragile-X interacting family-domain-containing protein [Fimicolochytrium jonesii]KAI8818565.1 cytoplasmic fragile-X interacting family-domain-containing protein [Fimicolochytrium jonesii]